MCIYCSYKMDGWTQLIEYDDTYQDALRREAEADSNYGFQESWDELRDGVFS